jgi:hypothetical protein
LKSRQEEEEEGDIYSNDHEAWRGILGHWKEVKRCRAEWGAAEGAQSVHERYGEDPGGRGW